MFYQDLYSQEFFHFLMIPKVAAKLLVKMLAAAPALSSELADLLAALGKLRFSTKISLSKPFFDAIRDQSPAHTRFSEQCPAPKPFTMSLVLTCERRRRRNGVR
ncbi:unnamed protein product [Choristocarpus tenellus]